jgi:predicted HicB family RNase H-like nuclease
MPPGRPKTKTATLTLRVDPRVKAAAELAAQRDHRSVTNLVEVLILDHCKALNIPIDTAVSEETEE